MEGDAKSTSSAVPPTTPTRASDPAAAEASAENGHNARSSSMDTAIQKQVSSVQADVCFQIFGQNCGALIKTFSCTWDDKSGHHGSDIERYNKSNSALIIPNAIIIRDTKGQQYVFRNVQDRDECFNLIKTYAELAKASNTTTSATEREHVPQSSILMWYHYYTCSFFGYLMSPRAWQTFQQHTRSSSGTILNNTNRKAMTPQPQRTNSLAMANGYTDSSASRDSINSSSTNSILLLSSSNTSASMPSSPVTRCCMQLNKYNAMTVLYCECVCAGLHDLVSYNVYHNTFDRNMLTARNDQSLDDTIQMPPIRRLSAKSLALKQQLNNSNDTVMNGSTLKDNTSDNSTDYTTTVGLCWQDTTAAQKQAHTSAYKAAIQEEGPKDIVTTTEYSISVKQFYDTFIGDDASYTLADFHKRRGDWNIEPSEWHVDSIQGVHAYHRVIRFNTPIDISIGNSPKEVKTLKKQRCRVYGTIGLVYDTITTVESAVPYDRWIIENISDSTSDDANIHTAAVAMQRCRATCKWRIYWTKSPYFVKMIIEHALALPVASATTSCSLKCKNDVTSFNKALAIGMTEHLQSLVQPSNALVQDDATVTASGSMHNSRHTVQLKRQASLQVINGKLVQNDFNGADDSNNGSAATAMIGSNVILITIGSTRQLVFAATTTTAFVIIMIITAICTSAYSAEHTSSIASSSRRVTWPSWLIHSRKQQYRKTASDELYTQLEPVYRQLGENNLLLRQVIAQQLELASSVQKCTLTGDGSTQLITQLVSDNEALNSLMKSTLGNTNDLYSALFAIASAVAVATAAPAATSVKRAAADPI
eukprot:2765-Heterococcus_DN1.PRE.2